jgi:hypothetical protein
MVIRSDYKLVVESFDVEGTRFVREVEYDHYPTDDEIIAVMSDEKTKHGLSVKAHVDKYILEA